MNTLEVIPDTTATARSIKPAKSGPTLPRGNDAEVATELRRLVADAEDGTRRILIAGFFIDRIAAELPHGAIKGWLATHCPDITQRTTNIWRALANDVSSACGLKMEARFHFNLPALLAMPVDDVPEDQSDLRSKIDEMIAGKSVRQLVFAFKQAEEGADGKTRTKVGRRAGEGGRKVTGTPSEQLAAARELALEDWDQIDRLVIDGYRARFAVLDDNRINAQIATLEIAIKARRLWLNTPTERRTGDTTTAIEAIFPR